MCDPVTATIAIVGGAAAAKAIPPKAPKVPEAPTPEKPPQATQSADVSSLRNMNRQAAAAQGPMSTFLTGSQGIDPNSLNLGKTFLGQ